VAEPLAWGRTRRHGGTIRKIPCYITIATNHDTLLSLGSELLGWCPDTAAGAARMAADLELLRDLQLRTVLEVALASTGADPGAGRRTYSGRDTPTLTVMVTGRRVSRLNNDQSRRQYECGRWHHYQTKQNSRTLARSLNTDQDSVTVAMASNLPLQLIERHLCFRMCLAE
jgi:hypothetical protein